MIRSLTSLIIVLCGISVFYVSTTSQFDHIAPVKEFKDSTQQIREDMWETIMFVKNLPTEIIKISEKMKN